MAKKPKIRFAINVDGTLKNLMTVKVRASDQLLVSWPAAENIEWNGNNKVIEQHISIHASSKANATSIKITFLTENDHLVETMQFIPDSLQGWGHVAFCQACPDMRSAKYDLNCSDDDQIINLGSHDPIYSTLIYALIISDRPWNIKALSRLGVSCKFVTSGRYSVAIAYCYQAIASTSLGHFVVRMTSLPRVNKGEIIHIKPNRQFYTPRNLMIEARKDMTKAAEGNYVRVKDFLKSQPMPIDREIYETLEQCYLILTREPILKRD